MLGDQLKSLEMQEAVEEAETAIEGVQDHILQVVSRACFNALFRISMGLIVSLHFISPKTMLARSRTVKKTWSSDPLTMGAP